MDRYQFEDLISAYIENELSLSKRKEVESYLAKNPQEEQLVNQINLNIKALKNSPQIFAKENFNKRLLERIKSENRHIFPQSKRGKTLFGFSIFNMSILVSLFAILFVLSLEITGSISSLQSTQNNQVVDNINVLDEKEINEKLKSKNTFKENFTDLKNDTTKKEKKDFSKNIKYVND